ncbi:MAG: ATP-dependent DNA helicase RecG [Candidatus Marinimicrobia bacterium]|nr:ATP-dependent DNA helicase RecG [Candidatus Neomarinimicrobiota bacterium]
MIVSSADFKLGLDQPVQFVKGIGPVRATALAEAGVHQVADLLYYFPRRYLDRRNVVLIRDLKVGEQATIIGQVTGRGMRRSKSRPLFQVTISDGTGTLPCLWFRHSEWIRGRFQVGDRVAVHGKVEFYRKPQMIHPDFDLLDQTEDPLNTGRIIALYPGTAALRATGLDSRRFRRVIRACWERLVPVADHFSTEFRREYSLSELAEALRTIHDPVDEAALDGARFRLKFDEHFFLQLLMALRRRSLEELPGRKFPERGEITESIYRSLPFQLTAAQIRVMREIRADLQSGKMMNRLLQGEVGSGKTVLALLTAAIVAREKCQVAVMAPTEILAEQHYRAFKALSAGVDLPLALLTGGTPKERRAEILQGLKAGSLPLVIGTHALIQEDVIFKELALIIVDEQHRFGVLQRGRLLEKGYYPHVLAMTATPIPRTLAITYHGDMDVSLLDELPANRGKITTRVLQPEQLQKAYQLMRGELQQGRQCFVVYPVISESEKGDLKAAEEGYLLLSRDVFPEFEVGYLHGRMKSAHKESVMEAFQSGKLQLLVSTTVIEVGIDVPNATVMLIENAERFGLTQIHQLRGRIGRGELPGHCLLLRRGGAEETTARLAILERTSNGFEIADEDLKLRGPGELFGARQHGYMKFRLANLTEDGPIIRLARQAAFDLVRDDQNLNRGEHRALKQVFMHKYQPQLDFINLH